MPTDPTTKSQVQAYRFVLRRMQSALVRKDAVMLHEPMRTHNRAPVVGLMLGGLGLAAFFVVGLFTPTSVVEAGDIINVEDTAGVYVVVEGSGAEQPLRLVPVFNVASARLLYAALAPGAPPPPTKSVQDAALVGIPVAPRVGLPDWPQTLPDPARLVGGAWSVCDIAVSAQTRAKARRCPPPRPSGCGLAGCSPAPRHCCWWGQTGGTTWRGTADDYRLSWVIPGLPGPWGWRN